jgi:integrase
MRQTRSERAFELGDYWLSKDRKSPEIWCITWFDSEKRQTRRRSTGTSDLEQAKRALAQHVLLNTPLNKERPEDIELTVIFDRFWEKHASKLDSAERAKIAIEKWRTWWEGRTVADLSIANQEAFLKHLTDSPITRGSRSESRSIGSIARDWGVGRSAITWAYKNQLINSHPFVMTITAPADTRRERILSIDEFAALFNAAALSEHTWRYMLLATATAARPGAVIGITTKREQVDLERYRLNLLPPGEAQKPKKRKPILPIPATLIPWLRLWMQPENLVYKVTRKTKSQLRLSHLITFHGKRLTRARETFDLLKERAGITDPTVVAYSIRHTVATWMVEQGVPEREHEIWLGHRMPGSATTARYVHLKPDYLRNAASAIDSLFDVVAPLVTKPIKLGSVGERVGRPGAGQT